MSGIVHAMTPCFGMALDRMKIPITEQNRMAYFTHPFFPPVILQINAGIRKKNIITGIVGFTISRGRIKIRKTVKIHAAAHRKAHITRHLAA